MDAFEIYDTNTISFAISHNGYDCFYDVVYQYTNNLRIVRCGVYEEVTDDIYGQTYYEYTFSKRKQFSSYKELEKDALELFNILLVGGNHIMYDEGRFEIDKMLFLENEVEEFLDCKDKMPIRSSRYLKQSKSTKSNSRRNISSKRTHADLLPKESYAKRMDYVEAILEIDDSYDFDDLYNHYTLGELEDIFFSLDVE